MMTREKIYADMRETLGQVPGFFEEIPDDSLENEWLLFKHFNLSMDLKIPPKYRELIGVAISAVTHCWYCANFHGGCAKLYGATDAELQEAVQLAKFGRGWSVYLNGMLYDRDRFLKELNEIGSFLSKKMAVSG